MGVKFLIIALVYLAASSNANEIPGQTAASAASPGTNAVNGSTAKPAITSTVSPGSSDITTSSSVTTTTDPSKNPTNPQVARDVTDCSTKFQELTKNSAFSPEKIFLAGSGGMTPEVFCEQQKKSAAALNAACSAGDADKGVASAAATGISNMINFFCDKASPKVLVDKDSKCDESVKTVTRGCLTKSGVPSTLTSSVIYPSDLIIMMMKESNSTVVCNTKNCISSEMQKGTCPADQQKTILAPLDSLVSSCAAGSETSTTISPSDTSATIPSASTTTPAGPASTTTKSGRSSASTIQTNLLIALLPVSVLFF